MTLDALDVNRRDLGGGYFVEAVRRLFRWHVSVRYWFGPFAPRVQHRTFRRREDAEAFFETVGRPQ